MAFGLHQIIQNYVKIMRDKTREVKKKIDKQKEKDITLYMKDFVNFLISTFSQKSKSTMRKIIDDREMIQGHDFVVVTIKLSCGSSSHITHWIASI